MLQIGKDTTQKYKENFDVLSEGPSSGSLCFSSIVVSVPIRSFLIIITSHYLH